MLTWQWRPWTPGSKPQPPTYLTTHTHSHPPHPLTANSTWSASSWKLVSNSRKPAHTCITLSNMHEDWKNRWKLCNRNMHVSKRNGKKNCAKLWPGVKLHKGTCAIWLNRRYKKRNKKLMRSKPAYRLNKLHWWHVCNMP